MTRLQFGPAHLNPLNWPRRLQAGALLLPVLGFAWILLLTGPSTSSTLPKALQGFSGQPRCPNERWLDGQWVQRPPPHPTMAGPSDVYRVSGFTGCTSSLETWIHLANENSSWWDWRAKLSTYDWQPRRGCQLAPFDKQKVILRMLKYGGWHFVGDAETEMHFFSLSCMLHPYVRHAPFFHRGGGWKRSWAQYLYLDTTHPWVQTLLEKQLPLGFRADLTPLVTHKRIDLLFSLPELSDVGAWVADPTADPTTYWDTGTWPVITQSALEWIGTFNAQLPAGRYGVLIISTGANWLPGLFKGARGGMPEVVRLWRVAMNLLVARLVAMLENDKLRHRVVLFRGAVHGHEGCEKDAVRHAGPVSKVPPLGDKFYNWRWLPHMNDVLEEVIKAHNHPRLRFLRLDRPALLRPDAHTFQSCSHYIVGSGVLEDWTIYINHFLQHEITYST
ncbi:hypothetical protein AURDEDRAFT_152915 [Auricularia subglabra TFB-10046 SS5]|nr:hypothetical protein AURDEDRAFT_152915 [Auricularia subglabra TFB-10046 SS5]